MSTSSAPPPAEAATAPVPLPDDGCPATVADLPASPLYDPDDPRLTADVLVVTLKERRRTMVYREGELHPGACWQAALAYTYVPGDKERRGDLRTPEGWYRLSDRPWSMFYGALTIHYPNAEDAARGLEAGLIDQATHDRIVRADARGEIPDQQTRLGGQLLYHGGGSSADWTLGCIGLDDADVDQLRALLPGLTGDTLILP